MIKIATDRRQVPGSLPVLASEGYLQSLSLDYGWFVSPQFILPFYFEKQLFSKFIVLTSGTIYLDSKASITEEQAFLELVVAKARQLRADFIGHPRTTALFGTVPEHSIHIEFGSYWVDLSKGDEELFSRLDSRHRNVIRKAQRDGVVIRKGPDLIRRCHELIQCTMARQSRASVSLELLRGYQANLVENIDFYLARHNGVDQGCAVLISDSSSCYYLYGGSRKPLHNGAMCLLHWTAMLDMKRKGVGAYDFVGGRIQPVSGSKQESLQRFKSRFGSSFKTGYLWKYPLKRYKYSLFRSLCALRSLASGNRVWEDIIDNELRIARTNRHG